MKEKKGCSTWAFFNKGNVNFLPSPIGHQRNITIVWESTASTSNVHGVFQSIFPKHIVNLLPAHGMRPSHLPIFWCVLLEEPRGPSPFIFPPGVVFQHQPLPHQTRSYESQLTSKCLASLMASVSLGGLGLRTLAISLHALAIWAQTLELLDV